MPYGFAIGAITNFSGNFRKFLGKNPEKFRSVKKLFYQKSYNPNNYYYNFFLQFVYFNRSIYRWIREAVRKGR